MTTKAAPLRFFEFVQDTDVASATALKSMFSVDLYEHRNQSWTATHVRLRDSGPSALSRQSTANQLLAVPEALIDLCRERPIDGNVLKAVHLCCQRCREFGSAAGQSNNQWLQRSGVAQDVRGRSGDGLPRLRTTVASSLSPSRQPRPQEPRSMAPCARTRASPS